MNLPKEWSELKFVEEFFYREHTDLWAGSCELSVHMYYHSESNSYYGAPWTDVGGWTSPRHFIWMEPHTSYNINDDGILRNVVKFDLERTSRGIMYIECDPVIDRQPLIFMSKKRSM